MLMAGSSTAANRADSRRDTLWIAALLALTVAVCLQRPLLPIDETRYAAVAWEMWTRGDFLVPHLNGEPYHHKPPLLFWLIHAGWSVFGVNAWWPRLISPLFAAGTLALTVVLARQLWPERPAVARIAPFILVASLLFVYFASALMFDTMMSFFVALGFVGIAKAWRDMGKDGGRGSGGAAGFGLLLLGMGGALYSKGPVALVHLLPAALLAPWWMREQRPRWGRWYAGVLMALLGGAALILAWAVPAGIAGGPDFQRAIFWGQSAGRMVKSFSHQAPWWFYFAWMPLGLVPWLLWPRWWGGVRHALWQESGSRLVLLGMLFALLFFSIISGKRPHYLLPEFALFALFCARALVDRPGTRWSLVAPALMLAAAGTAAIVAAPRLAARLAGLDEASALYAGGALAVVCGAALLAFKPGDALADVRRVATAALIAVCGLMVSFEVAMREPYDIDVVAGRLAQYEREGRPLAVEGNYHGTWTFAGRLRQPLAELGDHQVAAWLAEHPEGRVLFIYRQASEIPAGLSVQYSRRYRGAWLAILGAPGSAPAKP